MTNKLKVIAIHGKAGTGKSTFAENLRSEFGKQTGEYPTITSIAARIKSAVNDLFGLDYDVEKNYVIPEIDATYGRALQVASEAIKEAFGRDIFVKLWAEDWSGFRTVIIDDLRFVEEYEWLKENTDCYFIKIPGEFSVDDGRDPDHISEQGLNGHFNFTHTDPDDASWVARTLKYRMDKGVLLNGDPVQEKPALMTIPDMHGRVEAVDENIKTKFTTFEPQKNLVRVTAAGERICQCKEYINSKDGSRIYVEVPDGR